MLKTVLKEIRSLIQFSNCPIFVFQPDLIHNVVSFRPDKDGVNVATLLFEGKTVKAISESENLASPAFKKLDDVRYGLKNQVFLLSMVVLTMLYLSWHRPLTSMMKMVVGVMSSVLQTRR